MSPAMLEIQRLAERALPLGFDWQVSIRIDNDEDSYRVRVAHCTDDVDEYRVRPLDGRFGRAPHLAPVADMVREMVAEMGGWREDDRANTEDTP